jgi:hypothetical protein
MVASFSIGLLQFALSPWGAPFWGWHYPFHDANSDMIWAPWLFLSAAWIVVVIVGLTKLGRRGRWLFLSAPLALLPFEFVFFLAVACIFWSNCL